MKTHRILVRPIKATPVLQGKYAKEVISEITTRPSAHAIVRNKKAFDLVKELRR